MDKNGIVMVGGDVRGSKTVALIEASQRAARAGKKVLMVSAEDVKFSFGVCQSADRVLSINGKGRFDLLPLTKQGVRDLNGLGRDCLPTLRDARRLQDVASLLCDHRRIEEERAEKDRKFAKRNRPRVYLPDSL